MPNHLADRLSVEASHVDGTDGVLGPAATQAGFRLGGELRIAVSARAPLQRPLPHRGH